VAVSTQLLPHCRSPAGQLVAQLPSAQACPLVQATPQRPQFAPSALKSAQPVAQALVPAGHAQAPFTQD